MKSLSGNLSDAEILDVIQLVNKTRASGKLEVKGKGMKGEIFFKNGEIIGSNFENAHGLEALKSIALIRNGFFSFNSERINVRNEINLKINDILTTLFKVRNEWLSLMEKIKSVDAIPILKSNTNSEQIKLTKEELKIIPLMDGKNSIRDIAEILKISYFDASKVIALLIDSSLGEIAGEKERFEIKPVKLVVGLMSNPLEGENGTWMSRILAMAPRSLLEEFENESVVWIDVKLVAQWEKELDKEINSILITTPEFENIVVRISPQVSLFDNIVFHDKLAKKFNLKKGDIVEVLPNA